MSHIHLVAVKALLSTVVVVDHHMIESRLRRHVRTMPLIKSRISSSCISVTRMLSTNMRRRTTMANVRNVLGRTMTGGYRNRKLSVLVIWRS